MCVRAYRPISLAGEWAHSKDILSLLLISFSSDEIAWFMKFIHMQTIKHTSTIPLMSAYIKKKIFQFGFKGGFPLLKELLNMNIMLIHIISYLTSLLIKCFHSQRETQPNYML